MKAKKIVTLMVASAMVCGMLGATTTVHAAADVTLKLAHADAEGVFLIREQLHSRKNFRNFLMGLWM